jgi:hypothetical protein
MRPSYSERERRAIDRKSTLNRNGAPPLAVILLHPFPGSYKAQQLYPNR